MVQGAVEASSGGARALEELILEGSKGLMAPSVFCLFV